MIPCEPRLPALGWMKPRVAGERRAVVVRLAQIRVEGLGEALWLAGGGGGDRGAAGRAGGRHRGAEQRRERRDQDPERDELDLPRLDLLAEVLGRAPDHQTADEDRQQDVEQDRIEPRADAAEDHLAGAQVGERNGAADPGEGLDRAVDRAARGDRRDDVEQGRAGDPEALFLALHVAAGGAVDDARMQPRRVLGGAPMRLGDVGDAHRAEEHDHHRRVDRVALAAVAGHPPVHEYERRGDDQHGQHLDEVREPGRVLERVRRVGVEEAAAVGAQLLDRLLGGDRPDRDRLMQTGDRVNRQIRPERLNRRPGRRGSGR